MQNIYNFKPFLLFFSSENKYSRTITRGTTTVSTQHSTSTKSSISRFHEHESLWLNAGSLGRLRPALIIPLSSIVPCRGRAAARKTVNRLSRSPGDPDIMQRFTYRARRIDRVNPRDPPPNCINQHALLEQDLNFLLHELSHDPPSQSFRLLYSVFSSAGKMRIELNDRPSFICNEKCRRCWFSCKKLFERDCREARSNTGIEKLRFLRVVLFNFISRSFQRCD